AVALERVHRLFDHAHAHAELVAAAEIGDFAADGLRLVDRAKPLQLHLDCDHEIIDHIAGQSRVAASADGVEASADADDRSGVALPGFQQPFIIPVGAAAFAHG